MSKTIYERINEKYIYLKSCINNTSSFRNTLLVSLELLLKIINDKNDDEFNEFYIKYMSNFQLKRYYFARLFNPFKECNFNKFDNLNDFIDKSYLSPCSVNEEFYYIELNKFLNDILIINLKLENEKKEIVKEVKKSSTKNNIKKSETIIADNDKKKKKKLFLLQLKDLYGILILEKMLVNLNVCVVILLILLKCPLIVVILSQKQMVAKPS